MKARHPEQDSWNRTDGQDSQNMITCGQNCADRKTGEKSAVTGSQDRIGGTGQLEKIVGIGQ